MMLKRTLLLLCFLGNIALAMAQQTKLVTVGDYALEMITAGTGEYTVIFESGFGTDYKVWGNVASEVMNTNQVLLYSRAGTGKSEPNPKPQTLERAVQSLTTLIEKSDLKAPFILVGHSYGAFIIRAYAAQHPDKVKGLVFVDPAHEKLMLELRKVDPVKAQKDVELQNSFMPDRFKQENELINQIFEKGTLPDFGKLPQVPVIVLTSVQKRANPELFLHEPAGVEVWRKLHSQFFSQFTGGAHIITANSGHNIHREEPELVISAISQVIQAAAKQKKREEHEASMALLHSRFTEAAMHLAKGKHAKAEAIVFDALKASGFNERAINTLAYQQLSNPATIAVAVLIFKYNTVQFASSANAYDSLGEALMKQGKLKQAEQQFSKAIELATINQDASTLKSSQLNLEKIRQAKKGK